MCTLLTKRHFYDDTFENKTLLKCLSTYKFDTFLFLDTLKGSILKAHLSASPNCYSTVST